MIKTIEQLKVTGKKVFVRVDFNVPLKKENGEIVVADDTRIREALPTITYLIDKEAKVILASHLGRPDGKPNPELSLEPVAKHLSKLLSEHYKKTFDVTLTDDCVGEGIKMIIDHLKTSQVILLENCRFHKEEEENDDEFAKQLASLAEVYINDAFGTAHRKHASTYGIALHMPVRGCGFLIQKEIHFLDKLLQNPQKPFVVIMGGSKVSDKIKTIENLFNLCSCMLIGGAMAHAFTLAKNPESKLSPNAKAPKVEEINFAKKLLDLAAKKEIELFIPIDDNQSFDIGPKTIEIFTKKISEAKTIFWNGPVGMFEKEEFRAGSFAIAKAMSENKSALKVIGGGDTVAAVNLSGYARAMDHISTGGGATLEYLEGEGLPGIQVLHDYSKV
jgi:phosphoglycerate kinase